MAFNIGGAVAQAAKHVDMNEAVAGGGGLELPAEGTARLRLVSYIELGVHADTFVENGVAKTTNKELVFLEFELSGAKWPASNEETGRTGPFTINITLPLSQNEKSNFYKMFKRLTAKLDGVKHFAELLGQGQNGIKVPGFIGKVVHVTKGEGADKKTYANLRDLDGFTIKPPYVEDPESGDSILVKVGPATLPIKCFLWQYADKDMWDSIFIDGRWDDKKDKDGKVVKEGVSKNYFQNRIMSAVNFEGSPASAFVGVGAGEEVDLGDAEQPDRDPLDDDADPLAGI